MEYVSICQYTAKEWEGISGLVSEPCNSKAFGKLLKAFKKISNSLRSDSEIFLNNAASQIPRITMNPQMRPKSLPIPSRPFWKKIKNKPLDISALAW